VRAQFIAIVLVTTTGACDRQQPAACYYSSDDYQPRDHGF
jgi:hypothetical protein